MKKLLFASIFALLLGSCSQEYRIGVDPIDAGSMLSVRVKVAGNSEEAINTRVNALGVDEGYEKKVNDLYLLFFERSGQAGNDYVFVDFLEIPNPKGPVLDNDIDMSNSLLNVTAEYHILGIANIKGTDYLNGLTPETWMQQWAGKTEADVIREALAWTASATAPTLTLAKDDAPVQSNALLMSGRTTKAANSFKVDLTLIRNQVRFDVVNNAEGYDLYSVAIYNSYSSSKIWNDGTADGALDYTDGVTRLGYYYGLAGDELNKCFLNGQVRGHFYVFENQVSMPTYNDKYTTCLIVGLLKDGEIEPEYFRVNIAPENQAQILYRDNAYILTINSVGGTGTEEESLAYDFPNDNKLDYVINQWDVTEMGVSDMDSSSMLSSPYKTVNIDLKTGKIVGREERGLPTNSFDITTITNIAPGQVEPLRFIGGEPVFYLNGGSEPYTGLKASLSGNKITFAPVAVIPAVVDDRPLQSGDRITGSMTLGYAGLRITVDVVQTDLAGDFLEVFLPDAGIPRFAPFENVESGAIRVAASGTWTAYIMTEYAGSFAFVPPAAPGFVGGNNGNRIGGTWDDDSDTSTSPVAAWKGDEFQVKTASKNTDPDLAREAFIVVRLDKDPSNYYKAIRLVQQQASQLSITPNLMATFDGTYDEGKAVGARGNLAAIANNTVRTFKVLSGTTGDETTGVTQNEWSYRIEYMDEQGLYRPAFLEDIPENANYGDRGIVPGAYNWFTIVPVRNTAQNAENSFTVDVTDKNTSGATRRGRILIFQKGQDPGDALTAKAAILVQQLSSDISFSPNSVPAVVKKGGESAEVAIQADKSLEWELRQISINEVGGKKAYNHEIQVLHEGGTVIGSIIEGQTPTISSNTYPVSEKFKVKFPKIYYPNRNITISVTVGIGIVGSELYKEMTFTQAPLTSPGFFPYSPQTLGYGNIHAGGSANYRYVQELKLKESARPSTSLTVNSNYLHMNYYGLSAAYDWGEVKNFRTQRDGLLLVVNDLDYDPHLAMINNSESVLQKLGYRVGPVQGVRVGNFATINTDVNVKATKIYQMLIQGVGGGTTNIESVINDEPRTTMFEDDISTGVLAHPDSAVPIVLSSRVPNYNGIPDGGPKDVLMTIDPKNNIIYQGESQIFDTVNGNAFLSNFIIYVKLASMWGSAFTDLMVDGGSEDNEDNEVPLPAPWDEIWGDNAGISE